MKINRLSSDGADSELSFQPVKKLRLNSKNSNLTITDINIYTLQLKLAIENLKPAYYFKSPKVQEIQYEIQSNYFNETIKFNCLEIEQQFSRVFLIIVLYTLLKSNDWIFPKINSDNIFIQNLVNFANECLKVQLDKDLDSKNVRDYIYLIREIAFNFPQDKVRQVGIKVQYKNIKKIIEIVEINNIVDKFVYNVLEYNNQFITRYNFLQYIVFMEGANVDLGVPALNVEFPQGQMHSCFSGLDLIATKLVELGYLVNFKIKIDPDKIDLKKLGELLINNSNLKGEIEFDCTSIDVNKIEDILESINGIEFKGLEHINIILPDTWFGVINLPLKLKSMTIIRGVLENIKSTPGTTIEKLIIRDSDVIFNSKLPPSLKVLGIIDSECNLRIDLSAKCIMLTGVDLDDISRLKSYEELDISNNLIEQLPDAIVTTCQKLNVQANRLNQLPVFPSLTHLDAADNFIKILPSCFITNQITHLNVSKNLLKEIGNITDKLPLQYFNCSYNNILKLPEQMFEHTKELITFEVSLNQLRKLPQLSDLPQLKHFLISNNQISELSLQDLVKYCPKLKLVNIAGNPIDLSANDLRVIERNYWITFIVSPRQILALGNNLSAVRNLEILMLPDIGLQNRVLNLKYNDIHDNQFIMQEIFMSVDCISLILDFRMIKQLLSNLDIDKNASRLDLFDQVLFIYLSIVDMVKNKYDVEEAFEGLIDQLNKFLWTKLVGMGEFLNIFLPFSLYSADQIIQKTQKFNLDIIGLVIKLMKFDRYTNLVKELISKTSLINFPQYISEGKVSEEFLNISREKITRIKLAHDEIIKSHSAYFKYILRLMPFFNYLEIRQILNEVSKLQNNQSAEKLLKLVEKFYLDTGLDQTLPFLYSIVFYEDQESGINHKIPAILHMPVNFLVKSARIELPQVHLMILDGDQINSHAITKDIFARMSEFIHPDIKINIERAFSIINTISAKLSGYFIEEIKIKNLSLKSIFEYGLSQAFADIGGCVKIDKVDKIALLKVLDDRVEKIFYEIQSSLSSLITGQSLIKNNIQRIILEIDKIQLVVNLQGKIDRLINDLGANNPPIALEFYYLFGLVFAALSSGYTFGYHKEDEENMACVLFRILAIYSLCKATIIVGIPTWANFQVDEVFKQIYNLLMTDECSGVIADDLGDWIDKNKLIKQIDGYKLKLT